MLVIEDDPTLREIVSLALSEEGYAVTAVEHGGVALAALERLLPAVIIADQSLPQMDGRAFLREYRVRGGSAPVEVTTGYSGGFADLDGAAEVLVKPYDLDALQAAVERHRWGADPAGNDFYRWGDVRDDGPGHWRFFFPWLCRGCRGCRGNWREPNAELPRP